MALRCPVCRADNDSGPGCRRCRADLTLLFALEDQRRARLTAAHAALAAGRWSVARDEAVAAAALRRDEQAKRLNALCALLAGDYATALRSHRGA